jgi:hypothetical protein
MYKPGVLLLNADVLLILSRSYTLHSADILGESHSSTAGREGPVGQRQNRFRQDRSFFNTAGSAHFRCQGMLTK